MTNTPTFPAITDATMICVEWADGGDSPPPCTWAAWKAANTDDLLEGDFVKIAEVIRVPGCRYQIGGGASPVAYVSRADTVVAVRMNERRDGEGERGTKLPVIGRWIVSMTEARAVVSGVVLRSDSNQHFREET